MSLETEHLQTHPSGVCDVIFLKKCFLHQGNRINAWLKQLQLISIFHVANVTARTPTHNSPPLHDSSWILYIISFVVWFHQKLLKDTTSSLTWSLFMWWPVVTTTLPKTDLGMLSCRFTAVGSASRRLGSKVIVFWPWEPLIISSASTETIMFIHYSTFSFNCFATNSTLLSAHKETSLHKNSNNFSCDNVFSSRFQCQIKCDDTRALLNFRHIYSFFSLNISEKTFRKRQNPLWMNTNKKGE